MMKLHLFLATGFALMFLEFGCQTTMPDRPVRMTRSYVYYLDGAGGGGPVSNWGRGLRQGLLDAGYPGAGEMFRWQTGLGVVADQEAGVDYKQSKAAECARRIQQYKDEHPNAPVSLVGLSAGTAVAVFTLEALPATCPVEDVILLGASISADYDLTRALRRVRHRVYVFTSEQDAVLAYLVPMAGTADRRSTAPAGLSGFQMPAHGSAETQNQYAKVSSIPWRTDFGRYGNFGAHTDTLKAPFVQAYLAPLIMQANARGIVPETGATAKRVRNPDYARWARFHPGAQVTFEGYQTLAGIRQRTRITAKLISKHEDVLVVERTYVPMEGKGTGSVRVQHFFVPAEIKPTEHPATDPSARVTRRPNVRLTVVGRPLVCEVKALRAHGDFPEWGRDIVCEVATSDRIPGGVVRVDLKSHKKNQPFEFTGMAVSYDSGECSSNHRGSRQKCEGIE